MQVAAKEVEVTRLANDVDSLGLQLGRARGELAKQVCGCVSPPPEGLKFGHRPEVYIRSCPCALPRTHSLALWNVMHQHLKCDAPAGFPAGAQWVMMPGR